MPRLRVLFLLLACAVGVVLGMGTFALTEVAATRCGLGGIISGSLGSDTSGARCEERPNPAVSAPAMTTGPAITAEPAISTDGAASRPKVPLPSTATRHVPGPGEPPRTGPDPATDRAMALVVGWAVLALVGGGLLAGRRPGLSGSRS